MFDTRSRQSILSLLVILFAAGFPLSAQADLWGTSVDPTFMATPATDYNRVFRFDYQGNKIQPDIPTASAGLTYPTGIAVAPDGSLYVSSYATGSILHFDGQTGAPIGSGVLVNLGLDPVEPAAPAQLAFGPDGKLYVSEFFGTKVRVYDPTTGDRLADAVTGLTSAGGLAFAPNGDLYVGDGFVMGEGQSARVAVVHEGVASTFGTSNFYLAAPSALQFLPNGDLLVADLLANYVARFDSTGTNFSPFAVIPPEIPNPLPPGANAPSNNPSGLALDEHGNVLISILGLTNPPDNRGALLRYALDGTPLAPLAEDLQPVGGIAWTPSLKTLAGDFDGDGQVDAADYNEWKTDFGKVVAQGNGADGNNNGIVDAGDYTIWRDNLPPVLDIGAGTTAPEPTMIALAALTAAALSFQRSPRRRNKRLDAA